MHVFYMHRNEKEMENGRNPFNEFSEEQRE